MRMRLMTALGLVILLMMAACGGETTGGGSGGSGDSGDSTEEEATGLLGAVQQAGVLRVSTCATRLQTKDFHCDRKT